MDDVENKFLQKVNLDLLQKETGMDLKELASLAENPEFLAGVEKALADMKARGIIREEVEQAIADMKAKGQL